MKESRKEFKRERNVVTVNNDEVGAAFSVKEQPAERQAAAGSSDRE